MDPIAVVTIGWDCDDFEIDLNADDVNVLDCTGLKLTWLIDWPCGVTCLDDPFWGYTLSAFGHDTIEQVNLQDLIHDIAVIQQKLATLTNFPPSVFLASFLS